MKKADLHYYVTSYFRSYLPGQKNLSGNTVSGYADAFRLLFRFCEEMISSIGIKGPTIWE